MDFTASSLTRLQAVDFTYYIDFEPGRILSQAPKVQIRPFILLQIFTPEVNA